MKGRQPDFRLMTSREKPNGGGNIYTTIGAAWKVGKGAISIQFEALPMTANAVLFPLNEAVQQDDVTDDEWQYLPDSPEPVDENPW